MTPSEIVALVCAACAACAFVLGYQLRAWEQRRDERKQRQRDWEWEQASTIRDLAMRVRHLEERKS